MLASAIPHQVLGQGAFKFSNVLAKDDTIVATSSNSPASEGASKAIDGDPATKYLNFDETNTGFTVTPKGGPSVITAISLTTANDAPERDPATWRVLGSNNGTDYEVIASGSMLPSTDRGRTVTFEFSNTKSYTSYRVLFPLVVNAVSANSMQIADVALLSADLGGDASRALNGFFGLPYRYVNGNFWVTDSVNAVDGLSFRSGPTPNNGSSTFEITGVPGSQTVTWQARSSTEANFDFLRFYVNGVEVPERRMSGSISFTSHSHVLPAGTHTLRWAYTKDAGTADGLDAVWIDSLVFTYPPVLARSPVGGTVNSGNSLRLTALGGGGPGTSVTWRRGTTVLSNGGRISGATGLELLITGVQDSDDGSYTVQLTNPAGTVTSAPAVVTVPRPASITSVSPTTATLAPGQSLALSVLAAGTPPLSYQWLRNGTAIAGATSASYSIASIALAEAGTYTVRVSNTLGSVTSSSIPVVVQAPPQITTQPANRTAAAGRTVVLSVSVTSSVQPVTYQWRRDGSALADLGRYSGTRSGELTILDVSSADAGSYTVQVSTTAGSVTSSAAALTVVPLNRAPTLASIPALTRLEDAAASTVALSGIDDGNTDLSQALTVTAISSNPSVVPNPTVTYTSPQATGSLTVTGAPNRSGTATITVTVRDNGGTLDGGVDFVERQFVVTVTAVNDPPTLDQPAPAGVIMTDTGVALPGAVNATPRTVQLTGISDGDGGFAGVTLTATSGNTNVLGHPTVTYSAGGSSATLTLPVPKLHSNTTVPVTVRLRDTGGTANGGVDALERTFIVQVVAINDAPTIAAIANRNVEDIAGEQIVLLTGVTDGDAGNQTLTVTAASSNLSIVRAPTVEHTGGTNATLRFTPVVGSAGTATITVTVKDNGGTANGGADTATRSFSVRVGPVPPEIETPPASQIVEFGRPAVFDVAASGIGLTYKWFKNGVEIAGATGRTLTLAQANTTDAATYRVQVFNANPEQIFPTADATLTVVGHPVRQTVLPTQQVEFTSSLFVPSGVTATRQWLKDGLAVPGATGASLVIPSAIRDSVGDYSVRFIVGALEYVSPPVPLRLRTSLASLFSTGLDDRRVRLPDRAQDLHYTLVSPSPVTGRAVSALVVPGEYPASEWLVGGTNSAWLSPSTRLAEPGGDYIYQTTFDLTGIELNSVRIAGNLAGDDRVQAIRLNGIALGPEPNANTAKSFAVFDYSLRNLWGADRFIDRAQWPAWSGFATSGDLSRASGEPGEPLVYDAAAHGPVNSVWWSWIAPDSGTYRLRSLGSAVPVILAVFDGRVMSRLVLIGRDDGAGAGTNVVRSVEFTTVANREYQFYVDGYGDARGVVGIELRKTGLTGNVSRVDTMPSVRPGTNTLEFVVRNTANAGSDRGLTGLRVEFTQATAVVHPPTVATGPVGGIQMYGARKEFTVSAPVDPAATYQWYRGDTAIDGANEPTLLFNRVEDFDAGSYKVRIENANGVVWSQPAEFLVDLPLTITRQPAAQAVAVGGTAQFSVRFRGNPPLSVQWYRNDRAIEGATGTNLTLVAVGVPDAGLYRAVVRDRDGSKDSEPASLAVIEAPVIVQQPRDLAGVERRDTLRLDSVVDGTQPFRLRWFRNGVPLAVPETNVLDLGLLRESQAGDYQFVAANLAGSATSRVARVSVNQPPSLTSGSDDIKADVGGSASFSVRASGTGSLRYSWFLDGNFQAGQEQPSLQLTNLTARTGSEVSVVVANDFGQITNRFRLDVFPPPVPVVSTGNDMVQRIRLRPGWNAMFLQVQPADNAVSRVFTNVPYTSIWRWSDPGTGPQFISEQSEAQLDTTRWQIHLPASHPGSFQNNLVRLFRSEAYLVHLGGTQEVTLDIAGKPGYPRARWATDGYTLTGFPVAPAAPDPDTPGRFLPGVTAGEFLAPSSAHFDPSAGQPRGLFRLEADGSWTRLGATHELRPGEAYWVYTRGASRFVAPFEVSFQGGTELTYGVGAEVKELQLQFPAASALDRSAPVARLGHLLDDQALPLKIAEFDPTQATTWRDLPNGFSLAPQVGTRRTVRIAATRARIPGLVYQGILKVQNGGTLYHIPLTVDRDEANVAAVQEKPFNPVGLWVGTVSITHVSEVNGLTTNYVVNLVTNVVNGVARIVEIASTEVRNVAVGSRPTPVRDPFDLPILLHADTNGVLRLLQQVTLLSTPPALGSAKPGGEPVLLTDPTSFSRYRGVAMRGRDLVGRRFSSPFFPMYGTNGIPFDRSLALGASVSASWALPADAPLNPFKHRYHPDHDNLDASFRVFRQEAYPVRRTVRLTLPEGQGSVSNPAAGQEELEGLYEEAVEGLHRTTITARGSFRVKRVLAVGALDPSNP